ncbi:MAG TPA: hypothetical protein VKG80_13800, partial [Trebonia sp.]|nr:hypothetical protein [Trebonia sp.]
HLPGVHPARRDPRRRPPSRPPAIGHLAGTGPPRPAPQAGEPLAPEGEESANPPCNTRRTNGHVH